MFCVCVVIGHVGPNITLANGCIVGAGCRLTVPGKIADNTVIFGSDCMRMIASDKPPVSSVQYYLVLLLKVGDCSTNANYISVLTAVWIFIKRRNLLSLLLCLKISPIVYTEFCFRHRHCR